MIASLDAGVPKLFVQKFAESLCVNSLDAYELINGDVNY